MAEKRTHRVRVIEYNDYEAENAVEAEAMFRADLLERLLRTDDTGTIDVSVSTFEDDFEVEIDPDL